uniref:Uncharacterized protein n=1 Tax=Helianthus annuus TaxID=4232 RepID=A0A251TNG0_HELAN
MKKKNALSSHKDLRVTTKKRVKKITVENASLAEEQRWVVAEEQGAKVVRQMSLGIWSLHAEKLVVVGLGS